MSRLNYAIRPTIWLLVLSVCLVLLAVNGFIGGYLMLADPNGAPMGMPVSLLERTLFHDFTIPGVLLIVIWGLGSLTTLIGLWARQASPVFSPLTDWTGEHWGWVASIVLGTGLFVWLVYQVFTLPEMAVIQYILFALALILIGLPLLSAMRRYYRLS